MSATDPQDAAARDLAKAQRLLREAREHRADDRMGREQEALRALLGAVGVALWVLFALPWVSGAQDRGKVLVVEEDPVSGWGLLTLGLSELGEGHSFVVFTLAVLPPVAALAGLVAVIVAVAAATVAACRTAAAMAFAAGLCHCGLYLFSTLAGDNIAWSFHATLFAGLTLWFLACGLSANIWPREAQFSPDYSRL